MTQITALLAQAFYDEMTDTTKYLLREPSAPFSDEHIVADIRVTYAASNVTRIECVCAAENLDRLPVMNAADLIQQTLRAAYDASSAEEDPQIFMCPDDEFTLTFSS